MPKKEKEASKPKIKQVSKKSKKIASPFEKKEERKEELRRLLIRKREDIVKEATKEIRKFKSGEKKQLVETVLDDGDLSVVDLAEDISLRHLSAHRETLMKIDAALKKIDEGTYGVCEDCGEEISKERLNIIPFAILCRDCQEKKELIEKIQMEEE